MKILIKVKKSREKCFLVILECEKLKKKIQKLIYENNHSQAIESALSDGTIIKEVEEAEIPYLDAKLILAEKSVHYDLM